jgi:hypothetical protein
MFAIIATGCSIQQNEEPPMPESQKLMHIQVRGNNYAGHNDSVAGAFTDSIITTRDDTIKIEITGAGKKDVRNRTVHAYKLRVLNSGEMTRSLTGNSSVEYQSLEGEYLYYAKYRNSPSLEHSNKSILFSFK